MRDLSTNPRGHRNSVNDGDDDDDDGVVNSDEDDWGTLWPAAAISQGCKCL